MAATRDSNSKVVAMDINARLMYTDKEARPTAQCWTIQTDSSKCSVVSVSGPPATMIHAGGNGRSGAHKTTCYRQPASSGNYTTKLDASEDPNYTTKLDASEDLKKTCSGGFSRSN